MLFLSSIFVKFGSGMCIRDDTESFLLAKSQWQNSFLSSAKVKVLFCFASSYSLGLCRVVFELECRTWWNVFFLRIQKVQNLKLLSIAVMYHWLHLIIE